MQIEHLREFLALATTMNFSKTAQRLYLTQSTLSRHIAAIEEELGQKLLVRNSHQIELTEMGKQFFEDTKKTVGAYDLSLDNLARIAAEKGPILRIGYLNDAGADYLSSIVDALSSEEVGVLPQLRAMEYGELMKALREGRIDVALALDTDPEATHIDQCVLLGQDSYFAAVPLDHPLAKKASVGLEDLRDETIVFPSLENMKASRDRFIRTLGIDEKDVHKHYQYQDLPTLMYMIEQGVGVSLVLGHHRKRYASRVAFIPLCDEMANIGRCNICLLWNKDTERSVPGRWSEALLRLCR